MKKNFLIALWFTLVTTVVFGVLYPLVITGLAQVFFPIGQTDNSSKRMEKSLAQELSDNRSPDPAISIRGRLLREPGMTLRPAADRIWVLPIRLWWNESRATFRNFRQRIPTPRSPSIWRRRRVQASTPRSHLPLLNFSYCVLPGSAG